MGEPKLWQPAMARGQHTPLISRSFRENKLTRKCLLRMMFYLALYNQPIHTKNGENNEE